MPTTHAAVTPRDSVAHSVNSNSNTVPINGATGTAAGAPVAPTPDAAAREMLMRHPATPGTIAGAVRTHLGAERYSRYFVLPWTMSAGGWLEIPVASPLLAQLCQQHFMPVVTKAAREAAGLIDLPVRFVVVAPEVPVNHVNSVMQNPGFATPATEQATAESRLARHLPPPTPAGSQSAPAAQAQQAPLARSGRSTSRQHGGASPATNTPRYRIDQLVIGPGNRMGADAIGRVGLRNGEGLSVLALHGACGTGKTHLLHGAVESLRAARPNATSRLITGETFVNEFLASLRGKSVEQFRRSLRGLDLLCIDDADFLAGKSATQIELQHTIDAITSRGGSVVITSTVHPGKLTDFSPALVSRLSGGLCVAVLPPDDQTLQRLVRVLAARRGLVIEEQAIPVIMASAGPAGKHVNIRDLEGVLTKLDAVSRLLDTAPTRSGNQRIVGLVAVQKALGHSAPRDTRRAVRMEEVIRTVCFELSVSATELAASGRHPRVVLARALCTAIARRLTDLSYPEIARSIGRPNHSTVITAHQRLTGQIEACQSLDAGPRHGVLEVGLLLERLVRLLNG